MSSQKFELMDISNGESKQPNMDKNRKGYHVSALTGFVFLMLVAAVAVGVGIIVHFAGGNREVVCKCDPETIIGGQISECLKLANTGHTQICERCPTKSPMTSPSPTVPDRATTPTSSTQPPTANTTVKPKVKDFRIPTDLYPEHYNVEIQAYMTDPDPNNFTFKGHVKIWLRCDVATDNVTLHINILKVDPSSIRFHGDFSGYYEPTYTTFVEDKDRQFLILKLSGKTERGRKYTLEMNYTSPLKDDLSGLYLSTYSKNGQKVYLAASQMEPTDARKTFPCFDEPAIKSTFNITLVRPSNLTSISNMPIISNSTIIEDGVTYVKDVYAETKPMSTYLLAFIISDFIYIYNTTENGILFRTWSRSDAINSTVYALDVGIKINTYFEEFFDVRYPLPKQDMIAIPDLASGAMENWGLITYRETAMLYTPGISNEANKEWVVTVVSHELAHQWFGNLVSPAWWDDLWLNEGFASFVSFLGVDHVHPDWKMFDNFGIASLHGALTSDGLVSSHPLYVPVDHPDEINEIFDTITYDKGAAVIRMMRHFLGFDTFKRGMKLYLTRKQYSVATHNDLWAALTEQARLENKNIDVKEVMDTWTLQMNYPLVTVTRDYSYNGALSVAQERFLQNPDAPELGRFVSPFNYTWNIPLTFSSNYTRNFNESNVPMYWLWKNETSKLINGSDWLPKHNDWFICNVQQNGYYRVNYQISNWLALAKQLKEDHQVIPVLNRAQLINDAWNLAKQLIPSLIATRGEYGIMKVLLSNSLSENSYRSKVLSLQTAFSMIDYLENEREYVPWQAARLELAFIAKMLSVSSVYGLFQKFMQKKLNSTYQLFGLDNTGSSHNEIAVRGLIASEACRYGIPECLEDARVQYKRWMDNPNVNPIDHEIRTLVYCHAISQGGTQEWNFGLEMFQTADVASEKENILIGLSCSKEPWLLNRFMGFILDRNSPISKLDALIVVYYTSANPIGRTLVWNFLKAKFNKLKEMFGTSYVWPGLISVVTNSFNTEFELNELKLFKFQQDGNFGSGERAILQAIDKVESNVKWMHTNMNTITDLLKAMEN